MVGKNDVLLWFKESSGSSRVDAFCGLLRCCTALELRYFFTVLEDTLKDYYQPLKSAESRVNKFVKPVSVGSPDHPCSALKLSDVEDRANCLATLALLKCNNHTVASQLLYPVLSSIKREHVADDERGREELLLMLYMAGSHPAFSFAERRIVWEKIDMVNEVTGSASPVPDQDRGLLKKERSSDAQNSQLSNDWEDTGSTNWADCDDVIPDNLVVTGCQKSKGSGRFDGYRFEYSFEVTWSDGGFNRCYKTYSDLFQFQNKLLNENPAAAGKGSSPRIIPYLPGKKPLTKNTRELAERRLPEIVEYAKKLIELPRDILSSQHVINFFSSLTPSVDTGDGTPPAINAVSPVQSPVDSGHSLSMSESMLDSFNSTPRYSQDSASTVYPVNSSGNISPNGSMTHEKSPVASSRHDNASRDGESSAEKHTPKQDPPVCVPRIGGGVVYYEPHSVASGVNCLDRQGTTPSPAASDSLQNRNEAPANNRSLTKTSRVDSCGNSKYSSSSPTELLPPSTVSHSRSSSQTSRSPSPVMSGDDSMPRCSLGVSSPVSLLSSCDEDADMMLTRRNTEPAHRRQTPSPTTADLSRTASATSVNSCSAPAEVKTFASLSEWLKALRLHKYSVTLEDYTFDMLMSMTAEEMEDLDMTTGARAKLSAHLEWMRKIGCDQFALSCKISTVEPGGRKSRPQSRANSFASLDRGDSGSPASITSASGMSHKLKLGSSDIFPMNSERGSSTWSLPEVSSSASDRPRSRSPKREARPPVTVGKDLPLDSSLPCHDTVVLSAASGSYRRCDAQLLRDYSHLHSATIKLPPGQQPRQLSVSSKNRRKPISTQTLSLSDHRPRSSSEMSWRAGSDAAAGSKKETTRPPKTGS